MHLRHSRTRRPFKDYDIISVSVHVVFACLERRGFADGSHYPEGLGALFNQEEVRARGHRRMIPKGLFSSKSVLAPLECGEVGFSLLEKLVKAVPYCLRSPSKEGSLSSSL